MSTPSDLPVSKPFSGLRFAGVFLALSSIATSGCLLMMAVYIR